ncbi:hypothetical protein L9F63_012926, partial [Diploptera punctata]
SNAVVYVSRYLAVVFITQERLGKVTSLSETKISSMVSKYIVTSPDMTLSDFQVHLLREKLELCNKDGVHATVVHLDMRGVYGDDCMDHDHKGQRMMASLDHLTRYTAQGHEFLEGIVTGHIETGKRSESVDHEETPQDSGVIIHVVPENSKARWNHVDDLDSFFARMYHYHQKHGFTCMMVQEALELIQFIFVVCFSTFLFNCVDYSVLFRDSKDPQIVNKQKITLSDATLSGSECVQNFGALTIVCLSVAALFWILRAFKVMYHLFQFWDIKEFFNTALKINDSDLDNLTWHEIQQRVREVQREQHMCIHKADLSELDIYHRILRFKNYTVAMVNKSLLPVKLYVPFLGEVTFFSRGLKYNIELLLFWGPWSPFENNWHLKEDFKKVNKRKELAQELSKHILWIGIVNFAMCPLILLWQILYSFFNYAEMIKREPGTLSLRSWSLYGRLYLRHFNELDHELNARLNRAYQPAAKYMNIFISPLLAVLARYVYFMCGAILAVLVVLTIYDEDVLTVEHVLTIITGLGVIAAICRIFIPDENLVWCPEKLLIAVLAEIHYLPDNWKGQAHSNKVHNEFSQLFHYKAVYVLEELLSPLITPFILCFYLRSRALDIVDFFRNFTVEVMGVGDVCSFAQMDIRRHGNPTWQANETYVSSGAVEARFKVQAEDGKTELSLLHFMFTNPEWKPPAAAQDFITAFRNQARKDVDKMAGIAEQHTDNPLYSSLSSLSSVRAGFNSLIASIIRGNSGTREGLEDASLGALPPFQAPFATSAMHSNIPSRERLSQIPPTSAVRGGLSHAEGPGHSSEKGLLYALQQGFPVNSLGASVFGQGMDIIQQNQPLETAAEMSLSAIYLHELHSRQMHQEPSAGRNVWERSHQDIAGEVGGDVWSRDLDVSHSEERPLASVRHEQAREGSMRSSGKQPFRRRRCMIGAKKIRSAHRKRCSLLRKLYPNTILLTQKSVHAIIIVEICKLPDEMSDLEDFDHVFGIRGEEEFDRVYQRIQLEEQENRPDENNVSGFIAENSGSPVIGTLQYQRPLSPSSAVFTTVNFFFCRTMNFEIPDEPSLITKFFKNTTDGSLENDSFKRTPDGSLENNSFKRTPDG